MSVAVRLVFTENDGSRIVSSETFKSSKTAYKRLSRYLEMYLRGYFESSEKAIFWLLSEHLFTFYEEFKSRERLAQGCSIEERFKYEEEILRTKKEMFAYLVEHVNVSIE